jgi:aspartate aminotransferase/aminotransferase
VIEQMIKLQQYTFVCAPHPLQWGAIAALDIDMSAHFAEYKTKRDFIYDGLKEHYSLTKPTGAFYAFPQIPTGPKAPWKNDMEFVAAAIEREMLIIPGNIFSRHGNYFRISYASDQRTLERGVKVFQELGKLAGDLVREQQMESERVLRITEEKSNG